MEEWQTKREVPEPRLTTGFLDGIVPIVDSYELKVSFSPCLHPSRPVFTLAAPPFLPCFHPFRLFPTLPALFPTPSRPLAHPSRPVPPLLTLSPPCPPISHPLPVHSPPVPGPFRPFPTLPALSPPSTSCLDQRCRQTTITSHPVPLSCLWAAYHRLLCPNAS